MLNNMTEFFKHKIFEDYMIGKGVRVGLFNGSNKDFNEVPSRNGYQRQLVKFGSPKSGSIINVEDIDFPVATGSWGNITHIGLFDSNGNVLWFGEAEFPKEIFVSDQYRIPRGYLILRIL